METVVPSAVQGETKNIAGMGCVYHMDPHPCRLRLSRLSIGIMVLSVATPCGCRTPFPINSYKV